MADSLGIVIPGNSGSIADLASLMIDRPSYVLNAPIETTPQISTNPTVTVNINQSSPLWLVQYTGGGPSTGGQAAHFNVDGIIIVPNNSEYLIFYFPYNQARAYVIITDTAITLQHRSNKQYDTILNGQLSIIATPIG